MSESSGKAPSAGERVAVELRAAFDWLARSQCKPHHAQGEWTQRGSALLPLGTKFNSVCLAARLVHTAAGTDDRDQVTSTLAGLLCGPVIYNRPQHQYYALVAPVPTARWLYPDAAPMLGHGFFLSVPAADMTGPIGLHWAVRPRMVGDLCPLPSVAALVHTALSETEGMPW
ncbi:hypothetical protein ACFYO9_31650 [Streptomyces sp. NPDC005863]|uniref:hypothetical protein n=1 Tax=unclassified Streptomyces TaxID=2593676 RepID=UPI00340258F6